MRMAGLQCTQEELLRGPNQHELAAHILKTAEFGGELDITDFGSAQDGFKASPVEFKRFMQSCLYREAERHHKDNTGPHNETTESWVFTRHVFTHAAFGEHDVVELLCQMYSSLWSGYGYQRVRLLPKAEVAALEPVEDLASRFDEVMKANMDEVAASRKAQAALETTRKPPSVQEAEAAAAKAAVEALRAGHAVEDGPGPRDPSPRLEWSHGGLQLTAAQQLVAQQKQKETALEVRAMLVASGCSDAQIDAATAAAHGDVNAAAEMLMDGTAPAASGASPSPLVVGLKVGPGPVEPPPLTCCSRGEPQLTSAEQVAHRTLDLSEPNVDEAALEVRAMLVASGYSEAQIDAATAAAHGDVNAAAERLYDSSM